MGIKDLIRAPGALRELRAAEVELQAESERLELRAEALNYTDSLISHRLAIAQGTHSPDAAQTAAAEFASGLVGRCLAVAIVEPEPAARLLTPSVLMELGRRVILRGNYAAWIDARSGQYKLRTVRHFSVVSGGIDARSWRYQLELAAPGPNGHTTMTQQVMQPGVYHVKVNENPYAPWYGTSPLANAGISSELLARVELKTAQELRGGVGGILPVPEGMLDDNKKALQTDLNQSQGEMRSWWRASGPAGSFSKRGLDGFAGRTKPIFSPCECTSHLGFGLGDAQGQILLAETQANAHGLGRQSAPPTDWEVKRFGAMIPEAHVQLRNDIGRDVCSALGIPPALYSGTDGGSSREGYRQLLTATLEPLAELITAEFRDKLGIAATLNFRKLAAADIAARARAFGSMVASGVSREDAAEASGLDL